MVAHDREVVEIGLSVVFYDLFDRRLASGHRDRRDQSLFPPGVLQAQRKRRILGIKIQRQGAARARREQIAQERKGRGLAVEVQRPFEKKGRETLAVLKVLQ